MYRTSEQLVKHYLLMALDALEEWQMEPSAPPEVHSLAVRVSLEGLLRGLGVDPDEASPGDY